MSGPNPPGPMPGAGGGGDLVGTVLAGRYRIIAKLGEGAMGAVYLGEHLKIGRKDAIKVLRDSLAADREAIARFLRGARNVSTIRHPNVCTIYDFSDTDHGVQFLAMEYVPGETLKDLLDREGALPVERAVHIASQAAEALQAAHDAGIVHRDLKPANIMIAPGKAGRDQVKVVDFDIAKGSAEGEGAEVTRHGFVVGTPEYMSPEQLIGEALDGRSDVYSLALVLFRMIAGELPFRSKGTQDLMLERLTETPRRLDEVRAGAYPSALEAAVARALERRADDRTASATDFGAELLAAIGEAGAAAHVRLGQGVRSGAGTGAAGGGSGLGATVVGGRAQHHDVPSTKVVPGGLGAGRSRRPGGGGGVVPWWRKPIVLAGGGVGVAAMAVIIALSINGNGNGGNDTPNPLPPYLDTTIGGNGRGGGQGDDPDTAGPPGPEVDPNGRGTNSDSGDSGDGRNVANQEEGPRAGGGGSTTRIVVSAIGAEDRLFDDIYPRVTASAPRPVLIANRDTAQAFLALEDLDDFHRAVAARIVSAAYCYLRDQENAIVWADSMLALDPGNQGNVQWRSGLREPDWCGGRP